MWLSSSSLSPRPAVMWPFADQIGRSRRRRYPSKQEEDGDTMQGTALCCFVGSSERCRASCDTRGEKKKFGVRFRICFPDTQGGTVGWSKPLLKSDLISVY